MGSNTPSRALHACLQTVLAFALLILRGDAQGFNLTSGAALSSLQSSVPAAPVASTPAPILLQQAPGETLGCFHYGYAYAAFIPNASTRQNSSANCQAACKAYGPDCKGFSWWMPSARAAYECDLTLAGHSVYLKPTTPASGPAISGPSECPLTVSACNGHPAGSGFPGATEAASAAAFEGGHVPTNAQCWPRDAGGYPVPCSQGKVTVLEDTETGWPGKCMGLQRVYPQLGETCESHCKQQVLCSVWQQLNMTDGPQCWQGAFGSLCYQRESFQPARAQRLMHGNFRVLKNLKGINVMGLSLMFAETLFPNPSDASAHCQLFCVANLACNYWIYSTLSGCWAEDPDRARVQYPLTLSSSGAQVNGSFAAHVFAGEYIQHYCGGEADLSSKLSPLITVGPTTEVQSPVSASTLAASAPTATRPASSSIASGNAHTVPAVGKDKLASSSQSSTWASKSTPTQHDSDGDWPPYAKVLLGLLAVVVVGVLAGAAYLFFSKGRSKKRGSRSVVPQPSFDIEKDFQRVAVEEAEQNPLLAQVAQAPTTVALAPAPTAQNVETLPNGWQTHQQLQAQGPLRPQQFSYQQPQTQNMYGLQQRPPAIMPRPGGPAGYPSAY